MIHIYSIFYNEIHYMFDAYYYHHDPLDSSESL